MKNILVYIPYNRVQKLELPDIVMGTLAIVEKHDPKAMFVEGMFKLLQEEIPNVAKLSEIYNGHPLTPELIKLREQSNKIVQSILKKSGSIQNISSLSAQAAVIAPVVNRYLNGISRENQKAKTERVSQFIATTESDINLKTALETVGLKVYVDELVLVQQTIALNTNMRRISMSEKTIEDRSALKTSIVTALTNLFKSIELARVEHPDVDYMPMINELNQLLVSYHSLIKNRITRSKNLAKKTTVASSSTTTATAV